MTEHNLRFGQLILINARGKDVKNEDIFGQLTAHG